ncbi:OLC1v1031875C5 [Oldenlandia corymbosa var. corymbosa]|uniref:OLC1v1031875C5 n=1 Tax=Oldenlandia corymbosa var. corymbosa TaxID=529605 RepID=A0AAV1CJL5_OLDCO|nr:OLC1v1031875C5 [Oldenlandia corymbosa var. corymbosa]
MKKAKELSVLCDADVAVVIFSGSGKLYDLCSSSTGNGLDRIVNRYHSYMQVEGEEYAAASSEKAWDSGGQGPLTIRKLLENVERVLEEPDVDQLNLDDLVQLEEQLEDALSQTRFKKAQIPMQSVAGLIEMEKKLREQNKDLQDQLNGARNPPNLKNNGVTLEFRNLADGEMILRRQQQQVALNLL